MLKTLITLLLFSSVGLYSQLPESLPFKTFLGENEEMYVTGDEGGSLMTVKYNASGNEVFKHVSSEVSNSKGMDIVAVPGGEFAYSTGYFYNSRSGFDIILMKYKYTSNSGEKLWQRTYHHGFGDDLAYGITLDANGFVYICGYITDESNEKDFVVIKYDSSGAILTNGVYTSGNSGDDAATKILCDNNYIYTMGYKLDYTGFTATTDLVMIAMSTNLEADPPVILARPNESEVPLAFIFAELAQISYPPALSKVASIGYSERIENNTLNRNYFTVLFDGDGILWEEEYGNFPNEEIGTGITTDQSGNIVVTGYKNISGNNFDFATLKYDKESGNPIWSNPLFYDNNGGVDKATSIFRKNGMFTIAGFSENNESCQYMTTTFADDNLLAIEGWSSSYVPSYLNQNAPVYTDHSTESFVMSDSSVLTVTYAWNDLIANYSFVKYNKYGQEVFTGEAGGNLIERNSINNTSPVNFELKQNYPNPFNPQTNIEFTLPRDSYVTLRIYDILGREVKQLINGNIKQGVHTLQFNGSSLASGIYIYKISAISGSKSFEMVKKMTLIK
jgi:hypothetical protein